MGKRKGKKGWSIMWEEGKNREKGTEKERKEGKEVKRTR